MQQSAAAAAAKKATSVEVHSNVESRLKESLLVGNLNLLHDSNIVNIVTITTKSHSYQALQHETASTAITPDDASLPTLEHLYDQLQLLGFSVEHIHDAMRATVPTHGASQPAALDWLCWHLPTGALPSRFRGGRAAGDAAVRNTAVVAVGGAEDGGKKDTSDAQQEEYR